MPILALVPGSRDTTEPTQQGFIDYSPIIAPVPALDATEPVDPDAIETVVTTSMPDVTTGAPLRHFMDLFYFRIWIIPKVLDAQNPQFNTPIPFKIWNSFLGPNELEGLTSTGADGLTIDIAEGDTLGELELRTVNIVITNDAPYSIDATYNFDFTDGGSALRFLAELADILPIDSDTGIQEKFEWLTDILPSYDGTEQRLALRGRPRRTFTLNLTLLNDAERKALYDKIYKTIALTIIVPAYQYQSQLKADTVIGDNKIYCNPVRADLRATESLIIATLDGEFFYYRIDQVFDDHVTISTSFSQVIKKRGARVVGGFTGRLPDNTALSMMSISGSSTINVTMVDSREQIAYPDYEITFPMMKGLPMLLRNPLADGESAEAFAAGLDIIDNDTGRPAQYTAWDQRYTVGERNYLINWLFYKDEMQYWRTFLDYARGMQRPFYTPTYRADLVQMAGTEFLVSQIEVAGSEYATQYFGSPTYGCLQIQTDDGQAFQVEVSNAENNGVSTTLHFVTPIDADLTGVTVSRISYLLLCRLGTDTVTLTHQDTYTNLNMTLRSIKA